MGSLPSPSTFGYLRLPSGIIGYARLQSRRAVLPDCSPTSPGSSSTSTGPYVYVGYSGYLGYGGTPAELAVKNKKGIKIVLDLLSESARPPAVREWSYACIFTSLPLPADGLGSGRAAH